MKFGFCSEIFEEEGNLIRKDGLTQQEGKVMDALVEAWNEYIKLEKQHPSDIDEFKNGIHKVFGYFNDVNEAGKLAEEMRQKYYGEFAGLS